jgi:hypothetical protein
MSSDEAGRVARAVLYEGYLLYPYRASSVKNRQRFGIGCLYPEGWSRAAGERCDAQTECLVEGDEAALLDVRARFLQVRERSRLAGAEQSAIEREVILSGVSLAALLGPTQRVRFSFPGGTTQVAVEGALLLRATRLDDRLFRVTVRLENLGKLALPNDVDARPLRELALTRALCSAHVCVSVRGGELVSMSDPPEALRGLAGACEQVGLWPVLLGEPGRRDSMLAAPIVLYDYPRVAQESPGDLFDGTEIDEILTLRILTLTDDEKRQMRETDARARALLERTEALAPEDLLRLHGAMRELRPLRSTSARATPDHSDPFPVWGALERPPLESVRHGGHELRRGSRVRLTPRGGADAMDFVLAGRVATICAIEQDYEDRVLLAVTLDDDPGRDLGEHGWPGHRFFFRPNEVDPIATSEPPRASEPAPR